jgi:arsenical pump membrane protein
MHLEPAILLSTYSLAIAALVFGPSFLFASPLQARGIAPPWFLGKVVYVPLAAVLLVSLADEVGSFAGVPIRSVIDGANVAWVIAGKHELVLLILSFAFISLSLDRSGFFSYCALKTVNLARGDGRRLFVSMFLMTSVLTFFTSNDIVILAVTPIVLHIGRLAGIRNLIPLLISQFIAANTLSMGLYIGSPTNIVLGEAAGLTFAGFFLWMLAPTLAAFVVTLGVLWLVFGAVGLRGNRMQDVLVPVSIVPAATRAMRIKVAMFATCLLLLSVSSLIGVPLWMICAVTAVSMLAYDLWHMRREKSVGIYLRSVSERMPWAIAPFVIAFFVLVDALTRFGFTEWAAQSIIGQADQSLFSIVLKFGFVSAFAVNVMNDIPSTVFWAEMLPIIKQMLPPESYHAVLQILIVGVNPGCYLTIIGALAGLMWMNILRTGAVGSDVKLPSPLDLTFYGILVIVPVIVVTAAVIVLQAKLFSPVG